MTQVRCQIRQTGLRLSANAIPREHPVSHERVPNVMNARSLATLDRLETGTAHDTRDQLLDGLLRVRAVEVFMPEESSVLVKCCARSPTCLDIPSQQFKYTRSKWQLPRLEELRSSYQYGQHRVDRKRTERRLRRGKVMRRFE